MSQNLYYIFPVDWNYDERRDQDRTLAPSQRGQQDSV